MYDLIVVGGGPAGAMCALEAACHGLQVVLIEKEPLPHDKLCGGALSPRVMGIVDFDLNPVIQRRIFCAVVQTPSNERIEVIRPNTRGYMVKRDEFDSFLLERARKEGVEIVTDTEVLAIEQLRTGIRALSRGDSFKGHILVGADGVNSTVARKTGIRKHWNNDRMALCIAADIPLEEETLKAMLSIGHNSDKIALEIYPWAIEHGYGWCFPKRDEISLGLGYKMKYGVKNLRSAWKEFLGWFQNEKQIEFDAFSWSAHRVPLAKNEGQVITRRTMLVGDAAGFVSPITGEGIYYAMRSGIIAGEVAAEIVREKNPVLVQNYQNRVRKEFGTEFSAANFVSNRIYKSKEKIDIICELAGNDLVLQDYMIDLALGTRAINSIRFDITKHMMRHYPVKSLRLLR